MTNKNFQKYKTLRYFALSFFIIIPVIAFFVGIKYQENLETKILLNSSQSLLPTSYRFNNCGLDRVSVGFNIQFPTGWSVNKFQDSNNPELTQTYRFSNKNKIIDITCGAEFGGTCDAKHQSYLVVENKKISACAPTAGVYDGGIAGADLVTPQKGAAFDFSVNFTDRNLLDQILSTFKFTN